MFRKILSFLSKAIKSFGHQIDRPALALLWLSSSLSVSSLSYCLCVTHTEIWNIYFVYTSYVRIMIARYLLIDTRSTWYHRWSSTLNPHLITAALQLLYSSSRELNIHLMESVPSQVWVLSSLWWKSVVLSLFLSIYIHMYRIVCRWCYKYSYVFPEYYRNTPHMLPAMHQLAVEQQSSGVPFYHILPSIPAALRRRQHAHYSVWSLLNTSYIRSTSYILSGGTSIY